jgi:hypothetical protein
VNIRVHSPFSYFSDLPNAGDQLSSLDNAEANLKELHDRPLGSLEYAAPESAEMKAYLDPGVINTDCCLLVTGQTRGEHMNVESELHRKQFCYWVEDITPRSRQSIAMISLLFLRDFNDLILASEAADNCDLSFGNTEMLRQ